MATAAVVFFVVVVVFVVRTIVVPALASLELLWRVLRGSGSAGGAGARLVVREAVRVGFAAAFGAAVGRAGTLVGGGDLMGERGRVRELWDLGERIVVGFLEVGIGRARVAGDEGAGTAVVVGLGLLRFFGLARSMAVAAGWAFSLSEAVVKWSLDGALGWS